MEVSQNEQETIEKIRRLQEATRDLRKTIPKRYKKQPLPKSMKDDEFRKLIGAVPDKKIYLESKVSFLLGYESGLRISEVVNLKKEHIDVPGKRIFIKDSKFGKDRVVPLPKTWKKYMIDFIPIKKSIRSLERNFKTCAKKAGLRIDLVFHSLRHSFATNLLERGAPINQLSLLMGHSSVGTTNVYIRANPLDALATYERVF